MGQVSTEQTVAIIESVADAIDAATPDTVTTVIPEPNYWWALSLVILPVMLGYWLNHRRKRKS